MDKPSDKIIEKVFNGLATTEEAEATAKWFATDEGQSYVSQHIDQRFLSFKEGYEEINIDHIVPSEKIFREIQTHIRRKKIRRILLRTAAVVIPLLCIAGAFGILNTRFDLFGRTEYITYYVPKGERTQMMFQDGTHIYVNSDSRIRYPKKFTFFERKIELDGEAYFKVEKNEYCPFSIRINEVSIRVHGTSFNVRAYPESKCIQVALDNGEVSLISPMKEEHRLKSGESLVYDKSTRVCSISKETDTHDASLWKQNILVLKNTPLTEVIILLNRWYNVECSIKDPEARIYSYTLVSENSSLPTLLSDLEKISPVRFFHENNKIIIAMKNK